jgi:cytoskeletal protein CcmA (bactofilin family)
MPFPWYKKSKPPDPDEAESAFIGQGTVLSGKVVSTKPLIVDGTIHGNVDCSTTIIVGETGVIIGELRSPVARINGRVFGNIHAPKNVALLGQANIQGDIFTGSLHVEPSVIFNGRCHIPQNVSSITKEEVEKAATGAA